MPDRLPVADDHPEILEGVGCLDSLLRRAAEAHGERPAVICGPTSMTFAELDARADRIAGALAWAQPARTVIAVGSPLHPDFAATWFGASRAGHIVTPLVPMLRGRELAGMLADAGARVAIGPLPLVDQIDGVADQLPELRSVIPLPSFDEWLDRQGTAPAVGGPLGLGDLAAIQFTSGTTGAPKGVELTHGNLTVNAGQTAVAQGLTAGSITLNFLPTWHTMHLDSAVWAAATQVLAPGRDVMESLELANRYRATHYYTIPARLAELGRHPALRSARLDTVRVVASGGSALAPDIARTISDRLGIPVVQGYGLAETAPLTHFDRPSSPQAGSVGRPVPGTRHRVVDPDTRRPLPAGDIGEVELSGPQVMRGYLDRPSPLEKGWLPTGDLGIIDGDDRLTIVDRIKDVFKHDNWIVSPAELERILLGHPLVREAAVVDQPDGDGGGVPCGFVVGDGLDTEAIDDLRTWVNDQVPEYKHLVHLEVVDALPKQANGKTTRRVLREEMARRLPAHT